MGRQSRYPDKREEVVSAVAALIEERHRNPTVREISDRTQISVATLHSYLQNLADEGLVMWRPKRHRSISLTPEGQRVATTRIPF